MMTPVWAKHTVWFIRRHRKGGVSARNHEISLRTVLCIYYITLLILLCDFTLHFIDVAGLLRERQEFKARQVPRQ